MRIAPEEKVKIHTSTIRDCVKVLTNGEWEDGIEGCLRVKHVLENMNLYNPKIDGKGVYIVVSRNFLDGRSRCLACLDEFPNFELALHRSKCWVAYVCNTCKKEFGTRDIALKHRTETTHDDYRPKTYPCPNCSEIFPIYQKDAEIYIQYHECEKQTIMGRK